MGEAAHRTLATEGGRQIQSFVGYALEQDGFPCLSTNSGHNTMSPLISEPIELLLFDLDLPGCNGMEIIKQVCEWSDVSTTVVSARDQNREKAAAPDVSTDDCLTRPLSATELLVCTRVVTRYLRRQNDEKPRAVYQVGGLKIDIEKRLTYLQGEKLHLTPMEYNLLVLSFKNCGKVLTAQYTIREVWGIGYGSDTQVLRTLMATLRREIEGDPAKPRYIVMEIGIRYRLVDE